MRQVLQTVIHVLQATTVYQCNHTMHLLMHNRVRKVITVPQEPDWIGAHVQWAHTVTRKVSMKRFSARLVRVENIVVLSISQFTVMSVMLVSFASLSLLKC